MKDFAFGLVVLGVGIGIFVGILWSLLWGWQYFKVFAATQEGKAAYAQAEQDKQIRVLEAIAANEAATSNALARVKVAEAEAKAEIAKANGVAEANKIIGDGLKGNEDYLRYLYITGLAEKAGQVIYVPTEGGLPLLEAGKR